VVISKTDARAADAVAAVQACYTLGPDPPEQRAVVLDVVRG